MFYLSIIIIIIILCIFITKNHSHKKRKSGLSKNLTKKLFSITKKVKAVNHKSKQITIEQHKLITLEDIELLIFTV